MEEIIKKKNIGVTRKTSEKIIEKLLERINHLNSLDKLECCHYISKVILFGSILTDKEKLGDIDVFIELKEKFDKSERMKMSKLYSRLAPSNCNFVERMSYFEINTWKLLKNKSKSLSLHAMWEFEELINEPGFKYEIIFEYDPKKAKLS